MCEEGLLKLWPKPYHPRPQVEGDSAEVTTRGVRPHAPVNHTVFSLCHGFIKFMYINKILMKTRLIFIYFVLKCELLCVTTSGSGFYLWVWILSVFLDFASGSGFASGPGYENPMRQTPCCIMWSTHNHGIIVYSDCLRYGAFIIEKISDLLINKDLGLGHTVISNRKW